MGISPEYNDSGVGILGGIDLIGAGDGVRSDLPGLGSGVSGPGPLIPMMYGCSPFFSLFISIRPFRAMSSFDILLPSAAAAATKGDLVEGPEDVLGLAGMTAFGGGGIGRGLSR